MPPNRSLCAALLALASLLARPAAAHGPSFDPATVEIVDRTENRVLPTYWHDGRRYVVGKPGNEYAIRVRNAGAGRVLAVMSVDGVNVITGDTASPQQSGYVLSAYEATEIAGWRTSLSRTAAFYFTALPDSYAARTRRPDNVGVIGVAIFAEKQLPVALDEPRRQEAARSDAKTAQAPLPSAPSSMAKEAGGARDEASRLGTGYGRAETSYASYTRFERASATAVETVAIYYDSLPNLLALGVPVAPPPIARSRPDPFPDAGRFVPDPKAQ
ncbi:MAG TPA: hypothetical protein VMN79_16660 [Casimicrobiaceae bacterium]|nr:hypothetical protein [Casimicrobiaceae bacterium]